ncbi:hypothetical protein NHX12_004128 [Muraenolepis orangiensis]|uniref:Uncharacterized protein n=1 Tax=Muraenolepis orangiensis TaxID=630683 RepID=A0A9Q0IEC3_9TELE|nr:hypothetical protein NHX12_004128 [Muraenolepis orangiensis]
MLRFISSFLKSSGEFRGEARGESLGETLGEPPTDRGMSWMMERQPGWRPSVRSSCCWTLPERSSSEFSEQGSLMAAV